MLEHIHVDMTPEAFLDALDAASEASDRDLVSSLAAIAFHRRNLHWQAAVRHVDNFIIAARNGDADLQNTCQDAFMRLVPTIRNGG